MLAKIVIVMALSSRNCKTLTPGALDRCIGDEEQKDWIHKEVSCALGSECNIIPVIDYNFVMPEPESLPETMRTITKYNGVRWIHDYQVSKLSTEIRVNLGRTNFIMFEAILLLNMKFCT